jgi:hypothetical protein
MARQTLDPYNNAPEALSKAVAPIQPSEMGRSKPSVAQYLPCSIAATPGTDKPVNIEMRSAATGALPVSGTNRAAQQPTANTQIAA